MIKRRLVIVCLMASIVLSSTPAHSVFVQQEDNLKGIKQFGVVVKSVSTDAATLGLTIDDVQADIKQLLKASGIEIVKADSKPYLCVELHLFKDRYSPMFIYSIQLYFIQEANLDKASNDTPEVSTWKLSGLGAIYREEVQDLRDSVKYLTICFINDYLGANP